MAFISSAGSLFFLYWTLSITTGSSKGQSHIVNSERQHVVARYNSNISFTCILFTISDYQLADIIHPNNLHYYIYNSKGLQTTLYEICTTKDTQTYHTTPIYMIRTWWTLLSWINVCKVRDCTKLTDSQIRGISKHVIIFNFNITNTSRDATNINQPIYSYEPSNCLIYKYSSNNNIDAINKTNVTARTRTTTSFVNQSCLRQNSAKRMQVLLTDLSMKEGGSWMIFHITLEWIDHGFVP